MKILAILLVVLGAVALLVPSFTFFTTERVADAGFFTVDVSKPHTIVMNPVVGAVLLGLGVMMMLMSRKSATI